jgi:hypothetical protein
MAARPTANGSRPETGPASVSTASAPPSWRWIWGVCLLLAASGGVRLWQDSRLAAAASDSAVCPIRLASLPDRLGPWETQGEEGKLDPQTQQIAGCTDYLIRTYADRRTGVALSVLISYGPAERVFPHSPLVCFPAVGFAQEGDAATHPIETGSEAGGPAVFRSLVYTRGGVGTFEREEVFYSYRHQGRWSPDAAATRKQFRNNPGMFKVQVQRVVTQGERRDQGSPTAEFLALLVPEIERSLAARADRPEVETSPASAGPAAKTARSGLPAAARQGPTRPQGAEDRVGLPVGPNQTPGQNSGGRP